MDTKMAYQVSMLPDGKESAIWWDNFSRESGLRDTDAEGEKLSRLITHYLAEYHGRDIHKTVNIEFETEADATAFKLKYDLGDRSD